MVCGKRCEGYSRDWISRFIMTGNKTWHSPEARKVLLLTALTRKFLFVTPAATTKPEVGCVGEVHASRKWQQARLGSTGSNPRRYLYDQGKAKASDSAYLIFRAAIMTNGFMNERSSYKMNRFIVFSAHIHIMQKVFPSSIGCEA